MNQIKPKKKLTYFIGCLFILAFTTCFFYVRAEIRYYSEFSYNLHSDYVYSFPQSFAVQIKLERDGFNWPKTEKPWDTAILKIAVRSDWSSILFKPFIEINYRGNISRQYFEKTAKGIRYLNLSRLFKSAQSLTSGSKITLRGHSVSWEQFTTELYLFKNVDLSKEKILVIAPHPDDAEIAAFGLYDNKDAYIVTITAGEDGKPRFKRFYQDKKEHAFFQGWIRTWDSITVPFWGGIPPERCINLGYFDGTLKTMFEKPLEKMVSVAGTSDLRTFRKYNLSDLTPKEASDAKWSNLVDDLSRILTQINPSVIVTPNPLTDAHPDHQFSTIALYEALQKTGITKGALYLYTIHDSFSSRWPFGHAFSLVSLPPYFSKMPLFDKIYSHHLNENTFIRKLFALDDMHGFRSIYFLKLSEYNNLILTIIQSAYLQWKTVLQARKYLRFDELFFVSPMEKAAFLREEFLKSSFNPLKESNDVDEKSLNVSALKKTEE
ncbi:MAG: PIG-L family deacetylase [Candidatus Omnitrophica bacterium]|nr:PIG-L family deacetylase [Candidatus Omnitrophota bacterium]MCX5699685.1 PIG-L family deacetylase [Candidatus Omnitrophota bacterium]